MRYVAVFAVFSVILSGASHALEPSGIMRDYDSVLESVGKEMGKEKRHVELQLRVSDKVQYIYQSAVLFYSHH